MTLAILLNRFVDVQCEIGDAIIDHSVAVRVFAVTESAVANKIVLLQQRALGCIVVIAIHHATCRSAGTGALGRRRAITVSVDEIFVDFAVAIVIEVIADVDRIGMHANVVVVAIALARKISIAVLVLFVEIESACCKAIVDLAVASESGTSGTRENVLVVVVAIQRLIRQCAIARALATVIREEISIAVKLSRIVERIVLQFQRIAVAVLRLIACSRRIEGADFGITGKAFVVSIVAVAAIRQCCRANIRVDAERIAIGIGLVCGLAVASTSRSTKTKFCVAVVVKVAVVINTVANFRVAGESNGASSIGRRSLRNCRTIIAVTAAVAWHTAGSSSFTAQSGTASIIGGGRQAQKEEAVTVCVGITAIVNRAVAVVIQSRAALSACQLLAL